MPGAVRQDQGGSGTSGKENGCATLAVGVSAEAAAGHLERFGGIGQVDGSGLVIQGHQHHVLDMVIVLPSRLDLALGGQITVFAVFDGQQAAAVDRQVEETVGAAERLAEFRMIFDIHCNTRQGALFRSNTRPRITADRLGSMVPLTTPV